MFLFKSMRNWFFEYHKKKTTFYLELCSAKEGNNCVDGE